MNMKDRLGGKMSSARKEDRILLKNLQNGNSDALRIIYEKYKTDMLAVALAMASDRTAADDAVHDVFVSFAGACRGLRIQRSLKSYLLTSIVNRLRNIAKSERRDFSPLVFSNPEAAHRLPPEEKTMTSLDRERIDQALAALPEPQRSVIVLYFLEGLKFRVIAESQGESINTVQSRFRYGMEKMRSFFREGEHHV